MAEVTTKMVSDSIEAFVNRDSELAERVIKSDDTVDELFMMVKNELIDIIKMKTDSADQAIDLIMIAKYFERIGDHAVNVAEWVVFSLTGIHKDIRIM